MLTGTATGLDRDGRLLVATGAETSAVAAGDVVHVRPARG
jgi:BirA family biotin operon repressor/biotin-[acetyl-CoA-carboxylase] ligase